MPGRHEVSLLASAAAGDEVAFRHIIAKHHEDMRRVCAYVTGSQALAEEATQAAWLIAWRKIGNVRDEAHLRPWLVGENARSLLGSRWFELAGTRLMSYPLDDAADSAPVDLGLVRPAPGMSAVEDAWFGPISANTIRHSEIGADGERAHWIITFDDLP